MYIYSYPCLFGHPISWLPWQMDVSPMNVTQDDRIVETPGTDDTTQPEIGVEGHPMEEDMLDEEEKDLLEDDLRRL